MCDGDSAHTHEHSSARPDGARLSRRRVLQGMVALAGITAGLSACGPVRQHLSASTSLPPRAPNAAGQHAYVLGMHLHASASEGVGSTRSQLLQAAAHGFDVAWFTEHDWRRRRLLFRPSYSFLPDEQARDGVWLVPAVPATGPVTGDSGGQLVTSPVSPNDPATSKGSLRLRATSAGSTAATVGHSVDSTTYSRLNYKARIAGRTVSIDVLPTTAGPDAWGEVSFRLSRHPASGDRPEGVISMVYRLRTDVSATAVSRNGTTGTVDVPVTRGRWQTVAFDLTADVARVWRDIDPRDNSLNDIQLSAVSRRRSPAELFFGYLRFDEQVGYDGLGVEHSLLTAYSGDVPDVLGLIGTEISLGPHINQYGGPQKPYDYGSGISLADGLGEIRNSVVDFIHSQGGLASINHPFKPGDASQDTSPRAIARDLLSIGAGGADILEVGYGLKGGGDLHDHLALWDTLSRNAIFLTGNGVSDDHTGHNWDTQVNRFYTGAWARGRTEADLLDGLGRGRVYVGYLGSFAGTLDMTVDGSVPMGAVSVGGKTPRTLRIDVTGLPSGGAVQVVRGVVDYAGVSTPDPDTKVLTSKGGSDLQSTTEVAFDAGDDSFVRLQVVDGDGKVVAFGQPTWLLRKAPPHGVPAARRTSA